MAHARNSDSELVGNLAEVFRSKGFDASSIADLAVAGGLERGSLYYRFPGGKEQMAAAVIAAVDSCLEENLFLVLQGPGSLRERVSRAADFLRVFYAGGKKSCTLDTLSLPSSNPDVSKAVQRSAKALFNAVLKVALESGATAAMAAGRAEDFFVRLEGTLIFARVLNDHRPFQRFLDELPRILLGEDGKSQSSHMKRGKSRA